MLLFYGSKKVLRPSSSLISLAPQVPTFMPTKIGEISPSFLGRLLDVIAQVVKVHITVEQSHADGRRIRVTEALIGDDTGCIILVARNDEAGLVQPGLTVSLSNARVQMFEGHMRLYTTQWGTISSSSDQAGFSVVNQQNNISALEYEQVP
eukprot:TRINITY_DN17904_c0_g1_i1.p1 TRINITY_DN17904_c0_g1~~TRINITY_DN17904_c0_g1_i1.p1  ORF type:complete len:151 (+),score=13.58 TRINITY_DN17904_c0_g1_i1:74-526(+)